MSGTVPPAPASDPVTTIGTITVSIVALAIFVAALVIAWWTNNPALQVLLGMAGANAGSVVGYWIGSSSGSKGKDATIAQMGTKP